MAVTDNINTIGGDFHTPIFTIVATVPVYFTIDGITILKQVSLSGAIANKLASTIQQVSMLASMNAQAALVGSMSVTNNVSINASGSTSSNIIASISISNVKSSGIIFTATSIQGSAQVNNTSSIIGSILTTNSINGVLLVSKIIVDATASQNQTIIISPPTLTEDINTFSGSSYVVVNLRTKSHTTYRDGNNNCYAETGKMLLGSLKTKNISDAFILGRSGDGSTFGLTNDEVTKRNYDVSFKSEHAELIHKKVKLAKGLRGVTWQVSFANQDESALEIRGVDIYVNPLKRHV